MNNINTIWELSIFIRGAREGIKALCFRFVCPVMIQKQLKLTY